MKELDQEQNTELGKLRDDIQEIKDILKPIAETYRTASTLGKWGMGVLVLISVVLGILLAIKNLIHKV